VKGEELTDGEGRPIVDLEHACRRIRELEKGLDDAVDLLLKRDKQLEGYERRICQIEEKLMQAGQRRDKAEG